MSTDEERSPLTAALDGLAEAVYGVTEILSSYLGEVLDVLADGLQALGITLNLEEYADGHRGPDGIRLACSHLGLADPVDWSGLTAVDLVRLDLDTSEIVLRNSRRVSLPSITPN